MPAYSKEEVREAFLSHIRALAPYWASVERDTVEEKISGALFSVLTLIDGSTLSLPAMDIVLRPHPEDKEFFEDNGENWFEDGMAINDDVHLHEFFYNR